MTLFALCSKYFKVRMIFSRNYPKNQDVSALLLQFLQVLCRFPGHSSSVEAFSPGYVVFSRTFFFCGGSFSRFCAVSRDILLPLLQFLLDMWRFRDIFLLRREFLPVLCLFPGYSSSAEGVSSEIVVLFGTFFLRTVIGRIFVGKNISLTLCGIKNEFCNEDI